MFQFGYRQIIACILVIISLKANSQAGAIRQPYCESTLYQHTIDSLKSIFALQGFSILKEAAMQMESENEMPIIVPMQRGIFYQFVFISEPTSRVNEVRMFDFSEKQVIYKKNGNGEGEGNIISYSYIPKLSEYHMIKPMQVNKLKKKLCGYVLLLKKSTPAG